MVQNDEKMCGSARQKLESIFDAGTFVELGAYTKRLSPENGFEGVVCGYGAVEGKLAFAFVQDSSRAKGAFDERHAKKIADMYALAVKNGAPVIGVFDSAGAVVYDGAVAMAAYGRFMKCVSQASGVVPQIAVIDGICGGSSAVAASMFDFTVTISGKSQFYVNSPFALGSDTAKAEFAGTCGNAAVVAPDEASAFGAVRELIALLPSNNAESAYSENLSDGADREIDFDPENYTVDSLLGSVADNGKFFRLYASYADTVVAGFASFGGVVAGVIACDPSKGGVLNISAARVAAKLESFCDSFNIPLVTFVDSTGLDVSLEAESAAYASELARLACAYTVSDNAKVSVVLGKAYGAAFTLLGSKSVGADISFALPNACVSVLSPEASVAFVWNDEVGEKNREEVEAEWKDRYASAADACECGEIDDIIDPAELRKRICAALFMLSCKADGVPARRHASLPL